jgi:PAS domain S-box-containing protein
LTGEVAQLHDVTTNDRTVDQPGANGALARGILDSVVVGVVQIDADRRVVYVNACARKMLEATPLDLDRVSLAEFQPLTIWPGGAACRIEDYPAIKCFETGLPQGPTTIGIRQASGETRWLKISAVPTLDPVTGTTQSVVATFIDESRSQHAEESLRHSEDRYRRLVEEAPDAIVVHQRGKVAFINEAGVKLYAGRSSADFLGRSVFDFVHPRYHPVVRRRMQQAEHGATTPLLDQVHIRLDRRQIHVEVRSIPCVYEGQQCVQVILRDVTQRHSAERQVRRQREMLRKFFNRIPIFVGLFDADGRVRIVNRQWTRVLGWGRGLSIPELLVHFFPDPVERAAAEGYMLAGPGWKDLRMLTRDGRTLDVSWAVIALSDGTRIAVGQNVTRRKEIEAQLRRHQAELELRVGERTEQLVQKNVELQAEIAIRRAAETQLQERQQALEQMLDMHERYRQLVAYEIHDAFVQDVIGALMYLDVFHDEHREGRHPDLSGVERALEAMRRAIRAARRMISGLRPPIIDERGVVPAIEYLVNELNANGMNVHLHHDVRIHRTAPVIEAAVFRIVQEALANVQRHSQSAFATLDITQTGDTLRVEIRDFGVGFDPQRVGKGHFGLRGIRERARLCDGSVSIISSPGNGTHVSVEIPLPPAEPDRAKPNSNLAS